MTELFQDILDAYDYIADDLNDVNLKKEVAAIRKKHLNEPILQESYLDGVKARDEKELATWDPKDAELWRSTDWKARNYDDLDTGEKIIECAFYYSENGSDMEEDVEFHKFLHANPIFAPVWKPIEKPFTNAIGPQFDGREYKGYKVLDRYESSELYDMLSR